MTITIEWWMFYTALAFLCGMLVGLYLGQRANPSVRRIKQLEVELEKTRDLLADYHERVARHFSRTSELFESFTKDYKSVYQHLADGCSDLCGDRAPRLSLEVPAQRISPTRPASATSIPVPTTDVEEPRAAPLS
ncbi:putative DUF1043 family protein [Gammaproteobacteria bacterium]